MVYIPLLLAGNSDFLESVDNLVLSWIKLIEQVLAQSEQVALYFFMHLIYVSYAKVPYRPKIPRQKLSR